jgi:peptidoglycan pentaglycine glycine transferase (the first glycine)
MTEETWDDLISSLPDAQLLQTSEWAEIKKEVGWESTPISWKDDSGTVVAAANILMRSVRPFGVGPKMAVCYVPRGPMMNWTNIDLRKKVIDAIQDFARKNNAIFIKIDPEVVLGTGIPGTESSGENPTGDVFIKELKMRKWKYSPEQIQFKNTVLIYLDGNEEDWLKKMKQKARYNLRLSQRSGVSVRIANKEDLPGLYKMYAQTAARDGFIIREEDYYLGVWDRFMRAGLVDPLIAEVEGKPVAGLILFHFSKRAWYLYGMSTTLHRDKMPNYLLQWEAMRKAKSHGCTVYDLWGAPDVFDISDSMFGVFRFKEGLGGEVIRTAGAWDYPVNPFLYVVYQQILPKILNVTRWFRRGKILQEVK